MRHLIILLMILCYSCKEKVEFPKSNIITMEIITVKAGRSEDTLKITNSTDINRIINVLNKNRKEVVKFRPNYSLIIQYLDSTTSVSVNGKAICISGGFKYELNNNLEELLNEYMRSKR